LLSGCFFALFGYGCILSIGTYAIFISSLSSSMQKAKLERGFQTKKYCYMVTPEKWLRYAGFWHIVCVFLE